MKPLFRRFEPWRIFFPSALLLAPLNVLLWLAARAGLITPPGIGSAAWHGREMLVGYGFAVIAGYLLKAMPLVTVLLLWLIWLAGRALWLVAPGTLPPWVEFGIGGAFPVVLAACGIRRFAPAKRLRNFVFPLVITALGIVGVAAYAVALGLVAPPLRSPGVLAVYVVSLLIMIMSGRLIPTATVGVLRAMNREVRIPPRPLLEAATAAGMLTLVILEGFGPPQAAGLVALALAAILLRQIWRWHSPLVFHDPEVWPLHVGFFWLAAGCALIGLERLALIHPPDAGPLHALAAGGIGSVTLVMIIRVARYRAGTPQVSAARLHATQILMAVAVVLRVTGGWVLPAYHNLVLWLAAAAWAAAYTGSVALLIPMAMKPAPRLSGA